MAAVRLGPIDVRDATEIERAVAAFARGSNDGLIALPGLLPLIHRELIIALAARHKLPAVYRYHVTSGDLICYGPDEIEQYRQAAGYVDRILKGEKPVLLAQAGTDIRLLIHSKCGGPCLVESYVYRPQRAGGDGRDCMSRW